LFRKNNELRGGGHSSRSDALTFDPALAVRWRHSTRLFEYGPGAFGPEPEHRRLDAIRPSLRDPNCDGPDPVYSIVMDVGREEHLPELRRRMLLFGAVAYASGRLGHEPVRSQGHVHSVSPHSGWSPPEIFEIWEGSAIIYAQQYMADDPGRCVAIEAGPGDQIVVPPGWAHAVINADRNTPMVFAACCDRQYGFVYDGVRARGGLAWFPLLDDRNNISWQPNSRYVTTSLTCRRARSYPELGLLPSCSIYEHFARNPDSVQWVSDPGRLAELWTSFEP
jgi:glucose-6-phosphate isomerase